MGTSKLNVGDFGSDVSQLHEKLKSRGFTVSDEEVKRKFYGPSTRDAVRACQTCHGLETTGEFNESTASVLDTPRSGPMAATTIAPVAVNPVVDAATPPLSVFERPIRAAEPQLT